MYDLLRQREDGDYRKLGFRQQAICIVPAEMTVTITPETPLQDDVRDMIVELNDVMRPLTPPEFQFQMTAEQIAESATTLFVARNEQGEAVGMGALKVHDEADGRGQTHVHPRQRSRQGRWPQIAAGGGSAGC